MSEPKKGSHKSAFSAWTQRQHTQDVHCLREQTNEVKGERVKRTEKVIYIHDGQEVNKKEKNEQAFWSQKPWEIEKAEVRSTKRTTTLTDDAETLDADLIDVTDGEADAFVSHAVDDDDDETEEHVLLSSGILLF